ncbi:MAG: DinB family protein [Candidatus Hodarchaeales archaeon]
MEFLVEKLKERRLGIVFILKMVPLELWEWKPHESMRSTSELAFHLASSPMIMYELLKGDLKTQEEFQNLEKSNMPINASGFVKLYDSGLNRLLNFCSEHIEDAHELQIQFFYQKEKTSIYNEVFDEIGHEWFHLGQLYVYLKQNGVPIDMGAYYGYKDPDPSIPPNK